MKYSMEFLQIRSGDPLLIKEVLPKMVGKRVKITLKGGLNMKGVLTSITDSSLSVNKEGSIMSQISQNNIIIIEILD